MANIAQVMQQGTDRQSQQTSRLGAQMHQAGQQGRQNIQDTMAVEAHNITSYQMQSSFGAHQAEPGRIAVTPLVSPWSRAELTRMGYQVETVERTYSPITAIWFDREHGTMQGGASDYGEDYGIAW